MKTFFTLAILVSTTTVLGQTYVYLDPDPAIEKEKKEKEAYFQNALSDINNKLLNCEKQCGSYAADANNPKDPCTIAGVTPKCICDCRAFYNPSIRNIHQQEKVWRVDIFRREEDYRKRKLKEQQQQGFQNQQQEAGQAKANQVEGQLTNLQQRYQQTQIEFSNAQTAADNAYQSAIASGKKESGAMLDATLASAQQISDPNGQLVTMGVGLAVSLFLHFWEKKQEKLEREAATKRAEERIQLIVHSKNKYVYDAININKYGFSDLVSKVRYAALLLVPKYITSEKESIFFTIPVVVPKYSDSTYPLKDEIEKKLLKALSLDKSILTGMKLYTLYPITDLETFQDEFTKKMGSGHLLNFSPELAKFLDYPFSTKKMKIETSDFWGNPVKPKPETGINEPKNNEFWNN